MKRPEDRPTAFEKYWADKEANRLADEYQSGSSASIFADFDILGNPITPETPDYLKERR